MTAKKNRTAVLQFEVTLARHAANYAIREVVTDAMKDTIENGGTFVLVVSDEKITVVQRSDAEDL